MEYEANDPFDFRAETPIIRLRLLMSDESNKRTRVPRGRLNRLGKLVGMTARVSGSIVQSSVQKALGQDDGAKAEAAKRVLSTLGEMKGAALKLGQTLSLGANHLPPEVRGIVSQLFSQAPALDYEQIAAVIIDELGGSPDSLFADFDEEPFAAASLGQVHRATLKTGEEVAVKVQYPGVADAMVEDMKNAAMVVKTLGMGTNLFDGKAYFNEVRDELQQELDYARELALLEEYRGYLEPWEDLCVPKAFPELCTGRVLTLERFDGPTVHEFVNSDEDIDADVAFRIGHQLTRAVYGPFFLCRVIHADTHPGNFIVRPDGTLGVLDFGAVKHFSEPFWKCFCNAVEIGLEDTPERLFDIMREGGFTIGLNEHKARELLTEIATVVGRPLLAPYDFGADEIVEDIKSMSTRRAADFLRVRPPPEGILFFRAVAGLTHNLRSLGSSGDWRPFFRECLEKSPYNATTPPAAAG